MRILFFFVAVFGYAGPLQVDVKARAAMLINADTGAILYEKNGFSEVYPASTTKLATALYLLDEKKADLNQMVKVSAEAVKRNPGKRTDDVPAHWHERDSTNMGLVRGEVLSLGTLLDGLMLVSANDGANVIAEAMSGSIPQFVQELNEYVKTIGCRSTHFMNPHGYHHGKHVTTPYDLCQMMRKALQVPQLVDVMKKTSSIRPKSNKRAAGEMLQFNSLVVPSRKMYYPKAIGGKTGFHTPAGFCLISAAEHEGRRLIACTMGCEKIADRYHDAKKLFETAFAEKKMRRVVVSMDLPLEKKVEGGKTTLKARLTKDVSICYYPSEEPKAKAFVYWDLPNLPIRKGMVVGEVKVLDERENLIVSEPMLAAIDVQPTFFFSMKEKWNRFFGPEKSIVPR